MSDATAQAACKGAETRYVRTTEHMETCRACGLSVRSDMVDHWFWGFAACCPLKKKVQDA
jgi:hypothetical protein